jgi:hypothetical protein
MRCSSLNVATKEVSPDGETAQTAAVWPEPYHIAALSANKTERFFDSPPGRALVIFASSLL